MFQKLRNHFWNEISNQFSAHVIVKKKTFVKIMRKFWRSSDRFFAWRQIQCFITWNLRSNTGTTETHRLTQTSTDQHRPAQTGTDLHKTYVLYYLGPEWNQWDQLGPLGTTWDHLGPLGTIKNVLFNTVRDT